MHLCTTTPFVTHILDFMSDKRYLLLIREPLKKPSP